MNFCFQDLVLDSQVMHVAYAGINLVIIYIIPTYVLIKGWFSCLLFMFV